MGLPVPPFTGDIFGPDAVLMKGPARRVFDGEIELQDSPSP